MNYLMRFRVFITRAGIIVFALLCQPVVALSSNVIEVSSDLQFASVLSGLSGSIQYCERERSEEGEGSCWGEGRSIGMPKTGYLRLLADYLDPNFRPLLDGYNLDLNKLASDHQRQMKLYRGLFDRAQKILSKIEDSIAVLNREANEFHKSADRIEANELKPLQDDENRISKALYY